MRRQCSGDPGLIRTGDLQFRKLLLYPPELRGHKINAELFLVSPCAPIRTKKKRHQQGSIGQVSAASEPAQKLHFRVRANDAE